MIPQSGRMRMFVSSLINSRHSVRMSPQNALVIRTAAAEVVVYSTAAPECGTVWVHVCACPSLVLSPVSVIAGFGTKLETVHLACGLSRALRAATQQG